MSAADDYRLKRPQFHAWLERCRGTGFAHGEELTMLLQVADNVREADETLRAAEARGLIRSTGCNPTLQQKFFGIGGMRWSTKPAVLKSWVWHRSTHGWEPAPAAPKLLCCKGQLALL